MPCLCCFSRRRTKSFPIHEKQRQAEVQKIFIRHVESIRVTPRTKFTQHTEKMRTKSKGTTLAKNVSKIEASFGQSQKKPTIGHATTRSRSPLAKLFVKSKSTETPSPLPTAIDDKPAAHPPSRSSISSGSDSIGPKKSSKHPSCADSYDLSKNNAAQKTNVRERAKPSGKSKVVLENVRKMIQDQNIQQRQDYPTRKKESARL